MKAVNLIPADQRRTRAAGGSELLTYVVLGILALVVAVGAAYAVVNRSVSDRRAELARVQAQAKAFADEAASLKAYTEFNALREKRSETVRSLAASRFDWSHALHEVARTIPSNAWLTGMRATVTPSSAVQGGVTDPLRSALQSPAIEIAGCTTGQDKVAGVISSLRRIDGVERVSLSSSERLLDTTGTVAVSGSTGGDDCRNGNARFAKFSMTLFFKPPSGRSTDTQATAEEKTK
jgi:Tfp pilus assembly protein PilN